MKVGGHLARKKEKNKSNKIRSEPTSNVGFFLRADTHDMLASGYTRLSENPEVIMGISRIADLVSNMTIQLMENTEHGDVRVKNELARKIDINPYSGMTRKNFIYWLVKVLLLNGDGNAVLYPKYKDGILMDLVPLPPSKITFLEQGFDYRVMYNGQMYDSDEVVHFSMNPDEEKPWLGTGLRIPMKDVLTNLKQAAKTKKGFMSSEYLPSLVVSVDSDAQELADEENRDSYEEKYLKRKGAGKPWIIPEGMVKVEQIKPLSLKDLAISESIDIDKRTVAGLIGVPAFFLGVGEFKRDEYNNFIDSKIMSIAQVIQQTLTKSLLISPTLYFRCNPRSLYNYDISTLGALGLNFANSGNATGNEARNLVGFDPLPELNVLKALENFIPVSELGNQKKLNGGDKTNEN